jgi:hypothetical protein
MKARRHPLQRLCAFVCLCALALAAAATPTSALRFTDVAQIDVAQM